MSPHSEQGIKQSRRGPLWAILEVSKLHVVRFVNVRYQRKSSLGARISFTASCTCWPFLFLFSGYQNANSFYIVLTKWEGMLRYTQPRTNSEGHSLTICFLPSSLPVFFIEWICTAALSLHVASITTCGSIPSHINPFLLVTFLPNYPILPIITH